MLGSSKTMLAVDAGHFSVKSVQGKFKNNVKFNGKIGDLIVRQTPQDQRESDIHHSLAPIYAKKSEIYTVTSLSDVIMREVNVTDDLTEYEQEAAIEVELSETLPFSLDQVYFDFKEIKSGNLDNSDQRYLVAASRRDSIDSLTADILSFDKNANEIKVDIDAYALGRLINAIYYEPLQTELILLVDIAHERSRYYFYNNQGLLFNREQQIGGKYATESIAEIYDLSFEDAQLLKHRDEHDAEFTQLVVKPFSAAFSEQLNLVIDFFDASGKADKEISKIVLMGGGSCLNGFVEELQSLTNKVVEMLDLSVVWPDARPTNDDWKFFSANYALAVSLLTEEVK